MIQIVKEHVLTAHWEQQRACNQPAQHWDFQLGEWVLLLLPSTNCKFLTHWQGPTLSPYKKTQWICTCSGLITEPQKNYTSPRASSSPPNARLKSALSTITGHWQDWVLPFSLHGMPATFQSVVDIILRPHWQFATAYLDDVVIHSSIWQDHLLHLREILTELCQFMLTSNP